MNSIILLPVESQPFRRIRVVIYARVSTLQDKQESSYDLQITELIKLVESNPNYELICVFADKESGRSTTNRPGFQKMMELAEIGGFDLIITKSISRFARNTVHAIECIRELRTKGINVLFDKENLNSSDYDSDFMLSILAAYAEEESQQISINTKWGIEKKMRMGFNTSNKLYGYKIIGDVYLIIDQEADIIKQIFDWYLRGVTYRQMISLLKENGVPSPTGNDTWSKTTLEDILRNEKFVGDMLLRKKPHNADPFNCVTVSENSYYVRNHHDAIVSREVFVSVQERKSKITTYSHKGVAFKLNAYAFYIYSVDTNKYFTHRIDRPKGKYEFPIILTTRDDKRIMFHWKNIQKGLLECSKNLVSNKKTILNLITSRFSSKADKAVKLISTLNNQIELVSISERIERYYKISDALINIQKFSQLDKYLNDKVRYAKQLSDEFDIDTCKKIFSSIVIVDLNVHVILSIGDKKHITIPKSDSIVYETDFEIIRNYKVEKLSFKLHIV
jgi:site-specific DNA recombinase